MSHRGLCSTTGAVPSWLRGPRDACIALALLLFAVVACGAPGGSGPRPTATGRTAAASGPVPSAAVPTVAVGERHADPALERRLPEVLGGVALVRESQAGTQLTRQSDAFDAFLAAVGGSIQDFSLASAYSAGGDLRAQVGAWQVRGGDTTKLSAAFVAAVQASSATPLDVVDLTLEGMPVTRIGTEGQLAQGSMYVWVDGDTILFVQTPDPALAGEAMTRIRDLAVTPLRS